MKDPELFSSNNNNMKSLNSNVKQIPTRYKHNIISLKSLPQAIPESKSFRQQSHYFTMKNSKEKDKKNYINENESYEQNSQNRVNKIIKNKNLIINIKNPKNFSRAKGKANLIKFQKSPSINSNNNNAINSNVFNDQKIAEESQQYKFNAIMNSINPYFSQSANNSIYYKNTKNLKGEQNRKLISCFTGWIGRYKGIVMKGYNTTNNTANNSIIESMEKMKVIKEDNKKKMKGNIKNSGKSTKTKHTTKQNNNMEFNIDLKDKNIKYKICQTASNSRKNSGDKYLANNQTKLMALDHNKLFLNKIRGFNLNYNPHRSKQKLISAQVTIDKKKNDLKKMKNNICHTKNHILRKYNQETIKLFNTNIKSKIKVSTSKLNNYNTNTNENFLKAQNINNLLNINNIKSNSAFSTRQNLKRENPLIKVKKSNQVINDIYVSNNNLTKGILYNSKYNNNIYKKIGVLNVNDESIELSKMKNKQFFPTFYYLNKIDTDINKKIMTAGNSPVHSNIKELMTKDIILKKSKNNDKSSYQNVKQILSKNIIYKCKQNKIPNLKSACITRKNSKNKEFKDYLNIKSENKNKIFKNNEIFYNDSNPNKSLKSINSLEKDNINESNINSNCNTNTNCKNSKKVFNSILNIGNNIKKSQNKKQNKNNNQVLDSINNLNKKNLHTKNNSSNNNKLKLNSKNINSSPNYKTKNNHLYEKKKVNISDNDFQLKTKKENNNINDISREKSTGIIKQKKKIKKITVSEKQNTENTQKKLINKEKIINLNKNNKNEMNKNLINKSKIEQILLQKEIIKSKKINNSTIIKNDDDLLNSNRNNHENSSRSKMARKSAHNRNIEQNSIFNNNNNTNTSLLSTMKDSNYYSQESENLSKYIKEYYKSHFSYPPTDISFYKFGRMIGRGAFGKVNIGLNILTGRIVAIKSFNKQNISNEKAKKKIIYETNLMRGLYHPSVTKILETFETDKYMLIIMEYISGGNLQNFVKKRRKLCEKTARILYRQLIQGIKYIHSKGIVHRDIKLENILLDLNNIVKICDFGVGKLTQKGQKLSDQCGTPVYMAPEIIKGDGYEGFPVDVWSSGVALYIMLSGNIPFNRDKTHDLQSAILNLPYKKIDDISDNANDLLKNILEKDPNKRFTPAQILEHPWMNEKSGNDDDCCDYNYDFEIKNVNKYHLFTNAESILLAKTHIDYRKAPKKDLAENFTIKNLYTIEDKKNNKNIETKSIILAPYNSMLTDTEEEEEEDDEKNEYIKEEKKKKKENKKNKLETIEDIKLKALNYYNQSSNPFDILDNFNLEIKIKNGIVKFHGKVKEFNMNYELNNNEEIDNGMLINSKDELVINDNENDKLENYLKNNNNNISNKETNKSNKSHRPTSPYKQPPINNYFVKMVCQLGYDEDYIVKSLEKNELNHATTIYYLFSNYENIK